ncbi:hypothetical protein L195_g058354, partial [Trifolium pratense]
MLIISSGQSDPNQHITFFLRDYTAAVSVEQAVHPILRSTIHVRWNLLPVMGLCLIRMERKGLIWYGCGGLVSGGSGAWLGGFARGLGRA